MRAPPSSIPDLVKVGPPFLHWAQRGSARDVAGGIADGCGGQAIVRSIDGLNSSHWNSLGEELGRTIGTRVHGNRDAIGEVMRDPHWVTGSTAPPSTVYVIDHAERMLSDIPAGMALWGTMAEAWAREWARPVRDGESWDHEPVALHFVHCAPTLPKDAPNMSRFEWNRLP